VISAGAAEPQAKLQINGLLIAINPGMSLSLSLALLLMGLVAPVGDPCRLQEALMSTFTSSPGRLAGAPRTGQFYNGR
jgi:hypothetical protein